MHAVSLQNMDFFFFLAGGGVINIYARHYKDEQERVERGMLFMGCFVLVTLNSLIKHDP